MAKEKEIPAKEKKHKGGLKLPIGKATLFVLIFLIGVLAGGYGSNYYYTNFEKPKLSADYNALREDFQQADRERDLLLKCLDAHDIKQTECLGIGK